jgi:hypothetical protein
MSCPHFLALSSILTLLGGFPLVNGQEAPVRWPAPGLSDQSYGEWLTFIRPRKGELGWREVRWHKSLSGAAKEARELQRPILLWAMNGHPCGET